MFHVVGLFGYLLCLQISVFTSMLIFYFFFFSFFNISDIISCHVLRVLLDMKLIFYFFLEIVLLTHNLLKVSIFLISLNAFLCILSPGLIFHITTRPTKFDVQKSYLIYTFKTKPLNLDSSGKRKWQGHCFLCFVEYCLIPMHKVHVLPVLTPCKANSAQF